MRCEHCKHDIDSIALDAKQRTTITCPECGKETEVRYTMRDELRDPSIVPFGNLKYASKRLSIAWLVFFFLFFLLLFVILAGVLTGNVKMIE